MQAQHDSSTIVDLLPRDEPDSAEGLSDAELLHNPSLNCTDAHLACWGHLLQTVGHAAASVDPVHVRA